MNPVLQKDLLGLLRLKRVAAVQVLFVAVLAIMVLGSWPQGGVLEGSATIGGENVIRSADRFLLGLTLGQIVLLVLFGALVPAIPLTSIATRPLSGVFAKNVGRSKRDLLGHTARVRIAADVGERAQVRVRIGGDDLLLRVRADSALPKDAEVLLVDYDAKTDTFVAESMSEVLDAGSGDQQP